jgi:hypothetical protein
MKITTDFRFQSLSSSDAQKKRMCKQELNENGKDIVGKENLVINIIEMQMKCKLSLIKFSEGT